MKLINKTNLRTDHLRAFVRRVAKEEMVDLKYATFTIIYKRISCRGSYIGGFACYGTPPRVTLKVPKDIPIDKVELAYVAAHEMAHSQGLHHRQMRNSIYSRRYSIKHGEDWRQHYLWANDLPLDLKPTKEKIKPTFDQTIRLKLDRCLKRQNQWSTKVKRSQTIYRKWKQRYQYYERQLKKAENSNK